MLTRLDLPIKRIGLLSLILGLIFFLVGFFEFFSQRYGSPIEDFVNRLFDGPFYAYRTWGSHARAGAMVSAWIGLIMMICGGLCAFAYEQTFGRLIRWIKTGS